VQQDDNRHYRLAPNMLLYGKTMLDRYDFIGTAHPLLGELSKTVSETVFMGILDDCELVYVDHVDSLDHNLRMTPQIGRRQAAHCTALGKMLLANLPPIVLDAFLGRNELPSATENTITDPDELRDALRVIHEQGYAFDFEEAETGICCVAAPIVNLEGDVVASISVSGPATRVKKKGLDTFLRNSVQRTAEQISRLTII
jgi:DNA-binding IclR family transcriptional regulator